MNPKNDTHSLICITVLSAISLCGGIFLSLKGYSESSTFATIGGSGLGVLGGYIGGKAQGRAMAAGETSLQISQAPPTPPEPKK